MCHASRLLLVVYTPAHSVKTATVAASGVIPERLNPSADRQPSGAGGAHSDFRFSKPWVTNSSMPAGLMCHASRPPYMGLSKSSTKSHGKVLSGIADGIDA
jgi:hypothetical protein